MSQVILYGRFSADHLWPDLGDPQGSDRALVFSTTSGKCDTHMPRALKRKAKKAGLNQDDFWLHKFRATFATTHLQAGVDLRTVMTWMGQTNLESIIRYLKPARNKTVIEKVNANFAAQERPQLQLVRGAAQVSQLSSLGNP
jgi:site-specific recombinase XerD